MNDMSHTCTPTARHGLMEKIKVFMKPYILKLYTYII